MLGRFGEAAQQYRLALAQSPDATEWLNNLAWLLATCPEDAVRDGPEAVRLAQHACELTKYETTIYLGTLAAAQAEAGRFAAAVSTAQKACDNAQAKGETELLENNRRLLELFKSQQPFHETTGN
jgi:protein O-mannosyl-transferase